MKIGEYGVLRDATPEEQAEFEAQRAIDSTPRPILPAQIKVEANRRILAIMPEYKQRNAMAFGLEAMMVHGPDLASWPMDLQTMNNTIQAQWTIIKAIRTRSNEIEAMDPIPLDYTDDKYWS